MKSECERTKGNRPAKAWRMLAFMGAGITLVVVLGGCGGNTPKSTENVVAPGSMDSTKQQQYEQRMKAMGGRPGAPGGGYPGGGAGGSMPHN